MACSGVTNIGSSILNASTGTVERDHFAVKITGDTASQVRKVKAAIDAAYSWIGNILCVFSLVRRQFLLEPKFWIVHILAPPAFYIFALLETMDVLMGDQR